MDFSVCFNGALCVVVCYIVGYLIFYNEEDCLYRVCDFVCSGNLCIK